jgi:hypothetical protein
LHRIQLVFPNKVASRRHRVVDGFLALVQRFVNPEAPDVERRSPHHLAVVSEEDFVERLDLARDNTADDHTRVFAFDPRSLSK